ncbi:hypothetical protein L1987_84353 [Smallanthus sonchifolius]|uniref:Uncharacterized protein n=1 Tax=Smallanthus sonchifolius TaxID=185202 RepID=A0ACB8YF45_9ASTR|nr:hypothetical protein L1987_84353 [Smallanthus sonchifolius]
MEWSSTSSGSTEEDEVIVEAICYAYKLLEEAESSQRVTRRVQVMRDRKEANERIIRDYFSDTPMYNEKKFRIRFRMSRELFMRICGDLEREYQYFQQREDARRKLGFTSLQKCTCAVRQLAYGTASDSWDEYLKMYEKTARDTLHMFCVINLYDKRYLRRPTFSDIQQIYEVREAVHGFPGMLGSIDCTHWEWKNCPTAWRGQHQRGDHPHPTLMLKAVASYDLWIWHAFFSVAGANNDIKVLDQSPIFDDIIDGVAPGSSFIVNDVEYEHGYYLADGIYPGYATFVKAYTSPIGEKRELFKKPQESAQKDIERAFGV